MKSIVSLFLVMLTCQVFAASTMKNKMNSMSPSQMDDLIRGEMSAVKTYSQVLEKVTDKNEKAKLEMIRRNHENAVSKLKQYATEEVKEDTEGTGAWGAFTKAWTGGAKLFGNKTALKALSQGEEHGLKEYREALEDKNINTDLKTTIKTELLPKQEQHLKTIKTFM